MRTDDGTQAMFEVINVLQRALDRSHPEWADKGYVDHTYVVEIEAVARTPQRRPGFNVRLRRDHLPVLSARFECTEAWQELDT